MVHDDLGKDVFLDNRGCCNSPEVSASRTGFIKFRTSFATEYLRNGTPRKILRIIPREAVENKTHLTKNIKAPRVIKGFEGSFRGYATAVNTIPDATGRPLANILKFEPFSIAIGVVS